MVFTDSVLTDNLEVGRQGGNLTYNGLPLVLQRRTVAIGRVAGNILRSRAGLKPPSEKREVSKFGSRHKLYLDFFVSFFCLPDHRAF